VNLLAIDCGNTRLKWAVFSGETIAASGALSLAELGSLASRLPQPLPQRIVVANVAGQAAAMPIRAAIEGQGQRIRWVRGVREECGVVSRYLDPGQLGADRWAALIGARSLHVGACLVVMAGTATTIDLLDADGVFQGGLILPGPELMRRALTENTAQLGPEAGEPAELPRCTADAIAGGVLNAQLGAVERMFRHIESRPGACCIVSGGAAEPVFERLALPKRSEPNLVLIGVARIGREPD
jgi:type III pantothenate kinase